MPSWLRIVTAILGEAEQIVPIFIHNPKSQQIEGIVLTTINSALGVLGGNSPATTTTTTTTKS